MSDTDTTPVTVATGEHSPDLGELFAAMSAAQGELTNPTPNAQGQVGSDRTYRYVDLDAILSQVRPVAAKYGLCVIQTPSVDEQRLGLDQWIGHKSGQFIRSHFRLPFSGSPQQAGSLLTYLRRYAVSALWQIAPDKDDDGAQAEQAHAKGRNAPRSRQEPNPAPSAPPEVQPAANPANRLRRAVFSAMGDRWPDCKGDTDEAKSRRRGIASAILHRDIPSFTSLTDDDYRRLLTAAQTPPPPVDPNDPFDGEE
jgi:hypothetical protein